MELAHHDVVFSESRLALHTHLRALLAVPSNALTPPSTPLGPGAGAGAAAAGSAAAGASKRICSHDRSGITPADAIIAT